jgi:hypothetical protein
MRAHSITVMLLCHVAIPAKHLQVRRETMFNYPAPPIASVDLFTVHFPIIMDMIESQKRHFRLTAACAFSAIMAEHKNAARPVFLGHALTPSPFVFGITHPSFNSLRAFLAIGFSLNPRGAASAEPRCIARIVSRFSFSLAIFALLRARVFRKAFMAGGASAFRASHRVPLVSILFANFGHSRKA